MNQNVTLLAAFAAGFLSFVSPCVLPLIPGYISFVSGVSLEEMRGDGWRARGVARPGLPHLARVRHRLLDRLRRARRVGHGGRQVPVLAAAAPQQDRRRPADHRRPAHHGGVQAGVPRDRKARAGAAQAGRAAWRDVGRHRLRVRMDAVHRTDPRRHPGDRRIEEQHR